MSMRKEKKKPSARKEAVPSLVITARVPLFLLTKGALTLSRKQGALPERLNPGLVIREALLSYTKEEYLPGDVKEALSLLRRLGFTRISEAAISWTSQPVRRNRRPAPLEVKIHPQMGLSPDEDTLDEDILPGDFFSLGNASRDDLDDLS